MVAESPASNSVFLHSLSGFIINRVNKTRRFLNIESSLKYTDLTSTLSLVAFASCQLRYFWLKEIEYISEHDSGFRCLLLFHMTKIPKYTVSRLIEWLHYVIKPPGSSKHLVHHPQEVGDISSWLQNGCSSSKYYIFTQCMCKVIKEAQCLPLIHVIFLLLLRRNILSEAPKIIPFVYHWPFLDHSVFLHWKEIRIVNIWYIHPLS